MSAQTQCLNDDVSLKLKMMCHQTQSDRDEVSAIGRQHIVRLCEKRSYTWHALGRYGGQCTGVEGETNVAESHCGARRVVNAGAVGRVEWG